MLTNGFLMGQLLAACRLCLDVALNACCDSRVCLVLWSRALR